MEEEEESNLVRISNTRKHIIHSGVSHGIL